MLKRSDDGRMLTGVCAGLGRYTGMDPVIFRVGFAALVVGSGIGIMLYVAAFLLMRSPNGGPGYAEQWSRRVFETETVMALLAAVFAVGLIINLAADGISTATVVVGTLLAIALLAAHARGVDLLALTRSLPERLRGKRGTRPVPEQWANAPVGGAPFSPPPASPYTSSFAAPPAGTASPASPADTVTDAVPSSGAVADTVPPAGPVPPADAVLSADAIPSADARPTVGQEYRRLSDLAREARDAATDTPAPARMAPPPAAPASPVAPASSRYGPVRLGGAGFDSSGEPFAPRGPYSRYTPPSPYEPHDWGYGRGVTGPVWPDRPKRPKSFIGALTMFVALVVGGIMVATQSSSSTFNLPLVGGVVLITIGAGLLVATWFGRGAGLVATGTIMSLLLVAGSTVNGIPKKIGSYTWEPVDSSQAVRSYSVGIGDGTLDLRETKLAPGSRTRFDASVSIGELKIIVPRTARVEVFGYTRLGDVKIEHTVQGGADVHHNRVLEPDVTSSGTVPVIELHIKAGIGDVEVHRAA
ncbi:PspC domain-containing protein [Sphaerisporangium sp. NPDC088356]|uniref:PspC domain-containing protein n=1 Tax=Sphaerisporangium sp. NPDC088356 TaxID=3154871 RepID=UPI003427871F